MNFIKLKGIFLLLLIVFTIKTSGQIINLNPDSTGNPWYAGGVSDLTPEVKQRMSLIPPLILNPNAGQISLPDSVDN